MNGQKPAVNPDRVGSKAAAHYILTLPPGTGAEIRLRFTNEASSSAFTQENFDAVFDARIREADEFYETLTPPGISEDSRRVQRQAFAGILCNKQYYHYDVSRWLKGDSVGPETPLERQHASRNPIAGRYKLRSLSRSFRGIPLVGSNCMKNHARPKLTRGNRRDENIVAATNPRTSTRSSGKGHWVGEWTNGRS